MTVNFEGRRFEDKHQARSLARWAGAAAWNDSRIGGFAKVPPGGRLHADTGDWIIQAADGTVRIEPGGNQDGYCTDCGKPVWWSHCDHEGLVTGGIDGTRWCHGPDGKRYGMTHYHALPGMAQYIVLATEGKVCHCLDRPGPHMHEIITVPPDRAHRLARARAEQGDDILADLRAGDGHIPDTSRAEAERRLWGLLEQEERS
jgi:hypothetical protein